MHDLGLDEMICELSNITPFSGPRLPRKVLEVPSRPRERSRVFVRDPPALLLRPGLSSLSLPCQSSVRTRRSPTHKSAPNAGTAVTDELKYARKSGPYSSRDGGLAGLGLSNSPVRTRSAFPQPSLGMVLLLGTFPVAWAKRRGLVPSNPRLPSR